ncbi:MAG: leucine-rich repeat domain-containing protein, partial [Culicoidibacterales bacterium]
MTQEQMKHKPIFIDKNLESIIEERLKKQNLPFDQNSLEQLQTLNISNANISTLDGIESCKNLRFLAASQNQITSLAPIKDLTTLEVISIWTNQLTSLAVLEKLPNLKQVHAFDNPLEECSASELLAMSFFKIQPVENREFACLDLATIVEKKQLLEA